MTILNNPDGVVPDLDHDCRGGLCTRERKATLIGLIWLVVLVRALDGRRLNHVLLPPRLRQRDEVEGRSLHR